MSKQYFPALYNEQQEFINSHSWRILEQRLYNYICTECGTFLISYGGGTTFQLPPDSDYIESKFKMCNEILLEKVMK